MDQTSPALVNPGSRRQRDLRFEIRAVKPLAGFSETLALARGATSEGKVLFDCAAG